jgi:DNA-binding transcriptional LysR family regulator
MINMRVITAVNYEQLDLNLLKVFDAVMTELNVTRAAHRLHMTQPAVSNALKRLRRLLNDELFAKVPSGVLPTPKALELWQPLREALTQIRQTIEPGDFDPSIATLTFTIAMNDFAANVLLPKLIPVFEESASAVNIRTIPTTHVDAVTQLEKAEVDIAVGVFPDSSPRLRSQLLFTSPFTCVMRRHHPLAQQLLTLERYVQAKHLLVTLTGEPTGFIDSILLEQGLKRRIMLTVNQFAVAPQLVADSDLLAVLPTRIVEMSGVFDQLHLTPLPLEILPSNLKMMWHERNHFDSSQTWLRSQLVNLCGKC